MPTLTEIETLTRAYADARTILAETVQVLSDELELARRRHLPGIKRAVAEAQQARDRLHAAIEAAPELFRRPKTLTLSGVRVGFMKSPGKLTWDDPDTVIRLIRKHLPDQAETLIRIREEPVRAALSQLTVAELKRLGVTVIESGDEVCIKPVDGAVDKLVEALLKENASEEVSA